MKSLSDLQSEYLATAYQMVIPETVLVGVACALFLLAITFPRRFPAFLIALAGLTAAAVAASFGSYEIQSFHAAAEGTPFDPRAVAPFDPTGAAFFVRWLALAAGIVFLLLSWPEVSDDNACEYFGCLLVLIAGTSLVGRANDLVSLFLALELVSIPTYVLLYLPVRTPASQEAAAKYFLLSVLSSAVLLFGFSYLYGLTGSTNLGAVFACLSDAHKVAVNPLALFAVVMVIAGLGFRITAFPFHFYAPDVYEGGPTGVIAQVSFIPKVVGFVALARILGLLNPPVAQIPFNSQATLIPLVLWLLAAATMTFGNVLALLQTNLRRLMAYSGIAHGGYMLLALVVACSVPDAAQDDVFAEPLQNGLHSLWMYLVAYGLMTVGTFAVLSYLGPAVVQIDDLNGLGQKQKTAAGALAVLLLSLIGLPATAGFLGKFLIFLAAFYAPTTPPMHNMYRILVVIAAINAAIGAVYYLRILGVMYLRSPQRPSPPTASAMGRPALVAALICAVLTVAIGVYPRPVMDMIKKATPSRENAQPTATRDS